MARAVCIHCSSKYVIEGRLAEYHHEGLAAVVIRLAVYADIVDLLLVYILSTSSYPHQSHSHSHSPNVLKWKKMLIIALYMCTILSVPPTSKTTAIPRTECYLYAYLSPMDAYYTTYTCSSGYSSLPYYVRASNLTSICNNHSAHLSSSCRPPASPDIRPCIGRRRSQRYRGGPGNKSLRPSCLAFFI